MNPGSGTAPRQERGGATSPHRPASSGNSRENQALLGYDGKMFPAMTWFSHR